MIRSAISKALLAIRSNRESDAGTIPTQSARVEGKVHALPGRKRIRMRKLSPERMSQHDGLCFTIDLSELLPGGDSMERPGASMLRLFENGMELGPRHSNHSEIERLGGGRFSHWSSCLFFSSSDGSSPLLNGYDYQVWWDDFRAPRDELPVSSLPLGVLLNIQHGAVSYKYKGIDCFKDPFDMALYQWLLWETKPRTIIEIGTWHGGSALWFADVLTTYGVDAHVHTFDIADPPTWTDSRISFHRGDVYAMEDAAPAAWVNGLPRPILVIDDAGHMSSMTSAVLEHFAPLLKSGEYMIVEDTIIHEMNKDDHYDGGPRRALREFLHKHPDYVVDRTYCDYYGENVTWNVNGYLRRL